MSISLYSSNTIRIGAIYLDNDYTYNLLIIDIPKYCNIMYLKQRIMEVYKPFRSINICVVLSRLSNKALNFTNQGVHNLMIDNNMYTGDLFYVANIYTYDTISPDNSLNLSNNQIVDGSVLKCFPNVNLESTCDSLEDCRGG
jgi:hypothetical protein